MIEILTIVLLLGGAAFFLIAALGIARFPDFYTRMHAAAKGSAFGAVLMLLGVALHFRDVWIALEVFVIISFLFITTPVAAQMIARAAYRMNVKMLKGTDIDELARPLSGDESDKNSPPLP